MTRDSEHARDILADAIWWLKGFGAGTTSDHDDDVHGLAVSLSEARIWLDRVVSGKVRRLGDDATGSVVMSYAEFERFVDMAMTPDCLASRGHARETADRILTEYRAEAAASARSAEIPF